DVKKQVAALREQIAKQNEELRRVENMLKDGAATKKQKDDIEAQIKILERQLDATLSTLDKNTSTINNNSAALEAQIAALDDRISKCRIISPVGGTVLVKYAEAGELASVGKPLMKIADLDNIYLRAYFTSDQLAKVNLGDKVKVVADFGGKERYDYTGRVAWISSESEFTPKTIQTKDSRANLVYAVKIAVENDGRLKIGLAGEVVL
ncbi:MAG: HlyD family efflux transporter periplasmic adaptor subunit, partial [Rikenellaceae bacterium]|nr:HlyD family efflux transporter periplasmic adaptor subunit [Rikenellaceae bacterium]